MSFIGDFGALCALWGWAWAGGRLGTCCGCTWPAHLGRLASLGAWALLGWAACLWGVTPHAVAVPLEFLPMHPVLGPVLWCGLAGAACAAAVTVASAARAARTARLTWAAAWPWVPWLAVALICGVATLGPPLRPDESIYHLSLPLQYLRAGYYVVVPGHGNSGFFALGDMLFMWCLAAVAPGAARGVQLLVALMGMAALGEVCCGLTPRRLALAGTLCLGVPVLLWDLCCAYVDCIEATFFVVGVAALARWYADPERHGPKGLAAAAWLLGCSAACRQLALVQLPALALVVLWLCRTRQRTPGDTPLPLGALTLAGLWALVAPLCFVLHNLWVFGNPLFPFAAATFPHGKALTPQQMDVLEMFLVQHGPMQGATSRQGIDALVHLPWALIFDAAFASPRFDGVVGALPVVSALLAGACALWPAVRRPGPSPSSSPALPAPSLLSPSPSPPAPRRTCQRLLLAFAALRCGVWLSTSWQARFLIAPLVALAVWMALAWPPLPQARARRGAAYGALGATAAMLAVGLLSLRGHWPALDARVFGPPADRYASRVAQWPASDLCRLAAEADSGARVMLVWTQRLAAFCPTALWSDSYDEAATLVAWLQADALAAGGDRLLAGDAGRDNGSDKGSSGRDVGEANAKSDLAAQLRAHGISHLLVDEAALAEVPPTATAAQARQWQGMVTAWQQVLHSPLLRLFHQKSNSALALNSRS